MPLSDSAGACSVGAGPTGGTNAFDLRSALLSAALRTPEPPLGPCRAGTLPWLRLGLNTGIWGLGSGVQAGVGVRGRRAAELWRVSVRCALFWPPLNSPAQVGTLLLACKPVHTGMELQGCVGLAGVGWESGRIWTSVGAGPGLGGTQAVAGQSRV